jgi:hypothetical protein
MKKLLLLFATLFVTLITFAQVTEKETNLRTQSADTIEGWKHGGFVNLGISQTSLTNWAAGGQSSNGFNGLINLFANYKKGDVAWDNSLDMGYGILKQGDKSPIKTDDKIDFMSKFGIKLSKSWYYAILYNFKTQMAPGYNYPNDSVKIKTSDFIAPAYSLIAIGLDYKPVDDFSVFIAPVTSKITIVNSQFLADQGKYGVEKAVYDSTGKIITPGKRVLSEFGGYVRVQYKHEFFKSVLFQTKLDLFSNYLKNPQNIVVNWENIFIFKVNKYISATLATNLIYDDKIKLPNGVNPDGTPRLSPLTQFKEILSIGFSYKF